MSLKHRISFFILLFLTCFLAPGTSAEEEEKRIVPTQDPFFQPMPDTELENLPEVEGEENPLSPEPPSFFENLPRAIGPDGRPTSDVDERFWQEEFGDLFEEVEDEWLRSAGYLEFHGIYSTNIDQSAPGFDSDLRVNPNRPEVSDYYSTIALGYEHEFAILPDDLKGAVRYDFLLEDYTSYDRENNNIHRLELATIKKLAEGFEWEIFGGGQIDRRDLNAQYYRPDHVQWHVGTEFRKQVSETAHATLGYQFRNRDYDKLRGPAPPETPFKDWKEHRFYTTYIQSLNETLTLNMGLSFSKRNHESLTLDEFGARKLPEEFRNYDLWEPVIALTSNPTEHQEITLYYRFRSLRSTGRFYDYQESGVGLLYEQAICPNRISGLVFRSSLEYANRNYDSQITEGSFTSPNPTVRDDEKITCYFALEKTLEESLTTGIDFYYVDNDSNDHSSQYQEDRYGFYVRYDF